MKNFTSFIVLATMFAFATSANAQSRGNQQDRNNGHQESHQDRQSDRGNQGEQRTQERHSQGSDSQSSRSQDRQNTQSRENRSYGNQDRSNQSRGNQDRGNQDRGSQGQQRQSDYNGWRSQRTDSSSRGNQNWDRQSRGNQQDRNQSHQDSSSRSQQRDNSSLQYRGSRDNHTSGPSRSQSSYNYGRNTYQGHIDGPPSNFNLTYSHANERIQIRTAPSPGTNIQFLVNRSDRVRVFGPGARVGYAYYNSNWNDSCWHFHHYVYDPYAYRACVSPWYYYSCLPAYVSPSVAIFVSFSYLPQPFYGESYNWRRYDHDFDGYYDSYDCRPLDVAISEIQGIYLDRNYDDLDRLLRGSNRVAIYVDGNYQYSMSADNFANMIPDNVDAVHTVRYEIVHVGRRGDDAQVVTKHVFQDAYGDEQTVYQTFRLDLDGGHARIVSFGTSRYSNY